MATKRNPFLEELGLVTPPEDEEEDVLRRLIRSLLGGQQAVESTPNEYTGGGWDLPPEDPFAGLPGRDTVIRDPGEFPNPLESLLRGTPAQSAADFGGRVGEFVASQGAPRAIADVVQGITGADVLDPSPSRQVAAALFNVGGLGIPFPGNKFQGYMAEPLGYALEQAAPVVARGAGAVARNIPRSLQELAENIGRAEVGVGREVFGQAPPPSVVATAKGKVPPPDDLIARFAADDAEEAAEAAEEAAQAKLAEQLLNARPRESLPAYRGRRGSSPLALYEKLAEAADKPIAHADLLKSLNELDAKGVDVSAARAAIPRWQEAVATGDRRLALNEVLGELTDEAGDLRMKVGPEVKPITAADATPEPPLPSVEEPPASLLSDVPTSPADELTTLLDNLKQPSTDLVARRKMVERVKALRAEMKDAVEEADLLREMQNPAEIDSALRSQKARAEEDRLRAAASDDELAASFNRVRRPPIKEPPTMIDQPPVEAPTPPRTLADLQRLFETKKTPRQVRELINSLTPEERTLVESVGVDLSGGGKKPPVTPPPTATAVPPEEPDAIRAAREAMEAAQRATDEAAAKVEAGLPTGEDLTPTQQAARSMDASPATPTLSHESMITQRASQTAARTTALLAEADQLKGVITENLGPISGRLGEAPKFSPLVEKALPIAQDVTKFDAPLLERAITESAEPVAALGGFKQSVKKLAALGDMHIFRDPQVQRSYEGMSHYADTQVHRMRTIIGAVEQSMIEAFGEGAGAGTLGAARKGSFGKLDPTTRNLLEGGVDPSLVARYIGESGTPLDDYVGTLVDALQRPSAYKLTALQRRAVDEYTKIINAERAFTVKAGVPIGEVDGVYIRHQFKDPDKADAVLSSMGVTGRGPAVAKHRLRTWPEYVKIGVKNDLPIETNFTKLLTDRLASTARARSNEVFVTELAKKTPGAMQISEDAAASLTQAVRDRIISINGKQWAFPKEVADEISRLGGSLGRQQAFATAAANIVDVTRGTLLNLDLSGVGRQSFVAALTDPVGWVHGMGDATSILLNGERGFLQWYVDNGERIAYAAQHGLNLSSTNVSDIATALPGRTTVVDRLIPGVKALNHIQFGAVLPAIKMGQFENYTEILTVARDNPGARGFLSKIKRFAEHLPALGDPARGLKGASDDKIAEIAAEMTNNAFGGVDWAKVGSTPDAMRKLFVLTEGYSRAQIGLVTRAAQLNPEGYLARRILMGEIATTAMVSTALSLILTGKPPEYDPTSTSWLDIRTPFGPVSILPHKSILRTMVQMPFGKKPGEFGSDDPALKQRAETLWQFASGRAGQLLSTGAQLARGKTFEGDPIVESPETEVTDKLKFVVRSFLPIILGQVEEEMSYGRGELPGTPIRASENWFGWSARRYPPSKPDGDPVPGIDEYYNRFDRAAEIVGGDDPAKVALLKQFAKVSGDIIRTEEEEGRSAAQHMDRTLGGLRTRIERAYGDEAIAEYNAVEEAIGKEYRKKLPDLDKYLTTKPSNPLKPLDEKKEAEPLPPPLHPFRGKSKTAALPDLEAARAILAEDFGLIWGVEPDPNNGVVPYNWLSKEQKKAITDWLLKADSETQRLYPGKKYEHWYQLNKAGRDYVEEQIGPVGDPEASGGRYTDAISAVVNTPPTTHPTGAQELLDKIKEMTNGRAP